MVNRSSQHQIQRETCNERRLVRNEKNEQREEEILDNSVHILATDHHVSCQSIDR